MSQPALRPTDHDIAADAELELWPGVYFRRERIAKHRRLVLYFGAKSRFVTYPTTSVNFFGPKRHVADIRRALIELGARRAESGSGARETVPARRGRNRHEPAPTKITRREEPLRWDPCRDPWEPLRALFQEKVA